jgi:outer membrane receptor protein involved in Fe transport
LHHDGPFVHPDHFRKLNAVLRYSQGDRANGWDVTAMGYDAQWNSTDQIPRRAVDAGQLDRFDTIDPTDGGRSHRYSLSTAWCTTGDTASTQINAYVIHTRLDLYSNFTYFLDNPIDGDQFAQPDRRVTSGVNASRSWQTTLFERDSENQLGVQFQHDNIHNALLETRARTTLSTTRSDHIVQSSIGVYAQNSTQWAPRFPSVAGVRVDSYRFDVQSDRAVNSGKANATRASPKLGLIFGPWDRTELYLNMGTGFHSNDARHRDHDRSEDRRPGRPRDAAGALEGLRSRRAHVVAARPANGDLGVPARLRLRARVRRRRRHHRSGPAEPARRHRDRELLQAERLADDRRRRRVCEGALSRWGG